MKVVIAQMKHETNTFSPVPTPIERFAVGTPMPHEGEAGVRALRGTGSAIGAFIELAEKAGATISMPVAGSAWPSGPVAIGLVKSGGHDWVVPAGAKFSDDQYKAFLAGETYVNFHTPAHKGGEIRAQLLP